MALTKTLSKLIVVGLLSYQAAYACSCAPWGNAGEMFKNAQQVLLAIPKLSSVPALINIDGEKEKMVKTRFTIIKNFKRRGPKEMVVFSGKPDGGNCGASFKKDSGLYVIFGYRTPGGRVFTDSCSLNLVDSRDAQLMAFLRQLNTVGIK